MVLPTDFDPTVSLPPGLEIQAIHRAVEYVEREIADFADVYLEQANVFSALVGIFGTRALDAARGGPAWRGWLLVLRFSAGEFFLGDAEDSSHRTVESLGCVQVGCLVPASRSIRPVVMFHVEHSPG